MPQISNPSQDRADYVAELVAEYHDSIFTYTQLLDSLAKLNDDIDRLTERDLFAFDHWGRNQSGPMDAEDAVASCRARMALDMAIAEREAVSRVIVERDTRPETQRIASLQLKARNIVDNANRAAR